MKHKTILRSSILIVLAILLIVGGNARAIEQLTVYLPFIVDGVAASPSLTSPPPSTTEPPPPTTEPPPPTTEPPPPTTEPPPPTTESPPPTTEPPPPTTQPPPVVTGDIRITNIFYDGVVSSNEPDEYVEIRNYDSAPIQLQNWTIRDVANHIFTFPNHVMQPNDVCRIYTNEYHPESCGFNYGSGSAIWNNTGDTATLRDGNGILIDEYSY